MNLDQFVLFDGAMGTQLQARGLSVGENPKDFNLSHPKIVKSIHKDYITADADVITTNTFQANRKKVKQKDLPAIIFAAISHVKAANASYVAYDMDPIGQLLKPTFPQSNLVFERQPSQSSSPIKSRKQL
ncbi:MAG: homocysteine S-methyltransferase family protein [Lactobacillales bacterium]|nr:homocysteine S-methyltransferase family protein [Lactobacillales bacterium]